MPLATRIVFASKRILLTVAVVAVLLPWSPASAKDINWAAVESCYHRGKFCGYAAVYLDYFDDNFSRLSELLDHVPSLRQMPGLGILTPETETGCIVGGGKFLSNRASDCTALTQAIQRAIPKLLDKLDCSGSAFSPECVIRVYYSGRYPVDWSYRLCTEFKQCDGYIFPTTQTNKRHDKEIKLTSEGNTTLSRTYPVDDYGYAIIPGWCYENWEYEQKTIDCREAYLAFHKELDGRIYGSDADRALYYPYRNYIYKRAVEGCEAGDAENRKTRWFCTLQSDIELGRNGFNNWLPPPASAPQAPGAGGNGSGASRSAPTPEAPSGEDPVGRCMQAKEGVRQRTWSNCAGPDKGSGVALDKTCEKKATEKIRTICQFDRPNAVDAAAPKSAAVPDVDMSNYDVSAEVGNTLDMEGADSAEGVVRAKQGQLTYCYEEQLRSDPSLSGRVEIRWNVAGGRVTQASVVANTTGNALLGQCIMRKIKRWRFPADVEGSTTWPFVFKKKSGW